MDMIIINQSVCDDEILHKIILAEEIGHYFTTIGNNIPVKYSRYSDRLKVDKCEELAMRWATNYLVPDDQLQFYLSSNPYATIESCYTYFEVTNDFMIRKFEDMAKRKITWPLSDERYLILSSLPSIYTMSKKGCD
jgi:Zn-dependent peptidase ImmA (M78 family)